VGTGQADRNTEAQQRGAGRGESKALIIVGPVNHARARSGSRINFLRKAASMTGFEPQKCETRHSAFSCSKPVMDAIFLKSHIALRGSLRIITPR